MSDNMAKKGMIKLTWNQKMILERIMEMYEDDIVDDIESVDYVDEGTTDSQLLEELEDLREAVKHFVYE